MKKIKDKVTTDYRESTARDLAVKAGQAFHDKLTNSLATGKSFADICRTEKVLTYNIPVFTPGTESMTNLDERLNFRAIHNLGTYIEPGKASDFIPNRDGGYVVYLEKRQPVSDEKVKAELDTFIGPTSRLSAKRSVQSVVPETGRTSASADAED